MNTNSNKAVNKIPSIDDRLASSSQEYVRQMVKALPEEVPSLAWRSALNAKLTEQTTKARTRRRFWWVVSPSFGLAVTAALCFVLFAPHTSHGTAVSPIAHSSQPAQASSSLEDSLVASHSDTSTSQDVVGPGLSVAEVQQSGDDPDAQDAPTS